METARFLYGFFSSTRLTAALLSVFCVACAAGSLMSLESGLSAVFHAPWFVALNALFALNLGLCCLRKLLTGAKPWGFLLLHAGVLVSLAGGLWSWLSIEKGVMIVGEGETASEFWRDSAERLPADPGLVILVKPGQKVNAGDVLASAGDRKWEYSGEDGAVVVNYTDSRGEYIRDGDGRPVLMLRRVSGKLPFSVQLEKFWIENHPMPAEPEFKLVAFAPHGGEPEIADCAPGSRGEAAGARWEVVKTSNAAKTARKTEGTHRIIVMKKGADAAVLEAAEGKAARADAFGVTVTPVKFYANARIEASDGGYRMVDEGGGMRNPAAEVDVTYEDGRTERVKLFAAMPDMGSMGGTHSKQSDPSGLKFAYQAPVETVCVESETGGESFAVFVKVESAGSSASGWVLPEDQGGAFEPVPGVRIIVADMRRPMPKSFKSKVTLLKDGSPVEAAIIEVNKPLRHEGFWLYQQDYDKEGWTYTVLEVVKDPGVPVSFAGFVMLLAGAALLFYVEPLLARWKAVGK